MAVALPDQEANGPGRPSSIARGPSSPRRRSSCGSPTSARSRSTIGTSLAVPSQFVRERLQHNHLGLIDETAEEASATRSRSDGRGRRHPPERGRWSTPASAPPAAYAAIGAPEPAPTVGKPLGAPGPAVPQLHVRRVRPRPVEPVRARRRDGRRRGAAVEGVQPAVHLRGRRASARPTCWSPTGHHMWRLKPGTAIEVRHVGTVRHGVHQGRPGTPGRCVPPASTGRSTSCSSTTSSSWPSARRRRPSSSTRSTICTAPAARS